MNSDSTTDECPICFDKILGINNCTTPCGHVFCFRCIAEAMNNNTACPCCRAELVESKNSSSNGDDIDIEYSDNEDDEDDDEDTNYDDDDDSSMDPANMGNIETVYERFTNRGYTLMEALMILLDRSSKTNEKFNDEYLAKLSDDFDEMIEELDSETHEINLMTEEDHNVITLSQSTEMSSG